MKKLSVFLLFSLLACHSATDSEDESTADATEAEPLYLAVGTYTKRGSDGIYTFAFNEETGELTPVDTMNSGSDPSFLAFSPDNNFLYAVNETDGGSVEAFSFSDGKLTSLNQQLSGGPHPCHVTIDATGKWCLVGNYTGGSMAILPINADGSLSPATQVMQDRGHGPNKARQEKPHVHSVNIAPNNKDVFVPDLGIDKIMAFRLNDVTGELIAGNNQAVTPGSGPRHFAFHPNGKYAYVIQELSSTVTAFHYTDGKLEPIEEVSTLPADFTGENACADIHISPDGRFLYGSNRFYDTIVHFAIDETTGKLAQLGQTPVGGKVPRNFTISPSGKWVLVANQESDNIVLFARDAATGALTPAGKEWKISMPVCLKWGK